jgi:hypothetical protein
MLAQLHAKPVLKERPTLMQTLPLHARIALTESMLLLAH